MPSHEERIAALEASMKTPGRPADVAARLAAAEKLLAEVAAVVGVGSGVTKTTRNGNPVYTGCFKAVADFLASIDNNPSTVSAIAAGTGLPRSIAARVVNNHKDKFEKQHGDRRIRDSALYWLKDYKVKQEADTL